MSNYRYAITTTPVLIVKPNSGVSSYPTQVIIRSSAGSADMFISLGQTPANCVAVDSAGVETLDVTAGFLIKAGEVVTLTTMNQAVYAVSATTAGTIFVMRNSA